jgi:hypothetical protein
MSSIHRDLVICHPMIPPVRSLKGKWPKHPSYFDGIEFLIIDIPEVSGILRSHKFRREDNHLVPFTLHSIMRMSFRILLLQVLVNFFRFFYGEHFSIQNDFATIQHYDMPRLHCNSLVKQPTSFFTLRLCKNHF